ncbi:hypothetical protein NDU88_006518 [Pleurodeles waltl]|uniref:Uncharacterized protein n=1 Tax=Pleurodeles waltl TaxID=8319 RepID=A0AAV7N124_PLEWA|nr:hypothetical protein NDU88_006518 [Pleurodeles waltl]
MPSAAAHPSAPPPVGPSAQTALTGEDLRPPPRDPGPAHKLQQAARAARQVAKVQASSQAQRIGPRLSMPRPPGAPPPPTTGGVA